VADRFKELEAEVEYLRNQISEMTAQNASIRRQAATSIPTGMEPGAIIPVDDGAVTRLYMQFPSGIRYVDFS
jgi:hypothetical protein